MLRRRRGTRRVFGRRRRRDDESGHPVLGPVPVYGPRTPARLLVSIVTGPPCREFAPAAAEINARWAAVQDGVFPRPDVVKAAVEVLVELVAHRAEQLRMTSAEFADERVGAALDRMLLNGSVEQGAVREYLWLELTGQREVLLSRCWFDVADLPAGVAVELYRQCRFHETGW